MTFQNLVVLFYPFGLVDTSQCKWIRRPDSGTRGSATLSVTPYEGQKERFRALLTCKQMIPPYSEEDGHDEDNNWLGVEIYQTGKERMKRKWEDSMDEWQGWKRRRKDGYNRNHE